ncbi:MAG TPA: hypothetical protein ENK82_02805, partial [Campylobacterales bacterium]|nr:hypothetical protein [Campylobacterales bacterium]
SNAQNIALDLKSRFKGNYTEVEKLKTDSTLNLKSFNAFGVNLNSLTPLNLKANNEGKHIRLALDSEKLQLEASSQDLNAVDFKINTDKIYPSKIVELDAELDEKFIQLDLKGSSTISERYVTLKGALQSNKNFKVLIDAVNSEEGLEAKLSSEHFKLEANGNMAAKEVEANLEIDSLKKLQKELQRLYPFTTVDVDGAMTLNAKLKGEQIKAALRSKKLMLEAFNVEDIALDADYANDLLQIDTLNFKTTGFKDKSLNQNFYLNQKGLVNLGEKREVLLDMHPKILIKGSGDTENLKATVQIEELLLGYPNYGRTQLSCDIDYLQNGEKKKIMGAVFLDKMKIVYESKFLDPSADNDVVIIDKKEKQAAEAKDAFLENTSIDLSIYAGEANYKTRDIDLTLDVNVQAQKAFSKPLVMLGKVENINGRVEQAPKLFTVVDSNIVFQGREEINPLLDLTVEHKLPDILITISIHGNAKRPKLTFTSEPPLPKKEILSYLLLGVSTASLAEGKGSLGREAQLFIMNQAARDLAYEVELDRVFIKDDGTGEGYAVQVGKKVQEDTMFVIETSKEGNSYILEYDVSKDVKVEVGRHQKTVPSQSIDLYYRKRFK